MEPAIGIRRGHVHVRGRDDQQRTVRCVRKRVDFFALADAEGRATKQKEGYVGAEAGGDIQQTRSFQLLTRQLEVADQGRSGVAGATSQPAASGNFLFEEDFDTWANAAFATQRIHGAINQIFLEIFLGERIVTVKFAG